ncbi:hypothetical protein [Roseivirga seohaensis]|uniref:hypothetical protein n=1 Tax=Roseivirga seohaensis TaxID=1914963 RepID=UPI003BAC5348
MTERSILFSPPLAAANRANANPKTPQVKTQTRRLAGLEAVNKKPDQWALDKISIDEKGKLIADFIDSGYFVNDFEHIKCPYGVPGDLLYIKEEHYAFGNWNLTGAKTKKGADKWAFKADPNYPIRFNDNPPPNPGISVDKTGQLNWFKRNSLHMPKAYAAQWLIIENIRVERLASISEADAIQEGIRLLGNENEGWWDVDYKNYLIPSELTGLTNPVSSFKTLIQSIHGTDIWSHNPWVWVIDYWPLSFDGRPSESFIKSAREQIYTDLQTQSNRHSEEGNCAKATIHDRENPSVQTSSDSEQIVSGFATHNDGSIKQPLTL